MPVAYFDLNERFRSVEVSSLSRRRLLDVEAAIHFDDDVTIVQAYRAEAQPAAEALVVDLYCGDVPNKNPFGFRSRERLAIIVWESEEDSPPSVLALRRDFPDGVHLHATQRGEPKWLCLYTGPGRDIMRTWTGANYLRRMRWWLSSAARGTLHAGDQPVEVPFIEASWELVVPPSLAELRKQKDIHYFLSSVGDVKANAGTLILHAVPATQMPQKEFGLAVIDVSAIVHGGRLRMPFSLGELESDLAERGVELVPILREALEPLPEHGVAVADANKRFIILVNFPIIRVEGGPVERTQQMALVVSEGRVGLGLKLGYYAVHEGKAFTQFLVAGAKAEEKDWRSLQVSPLAVLQGASSEMFRQYSGQSDKGPSSGVLVGVGSLGSELLNLFLRSGWGDWSVIDPDHIKPHNLARHLALAHSIGSPKVQVCDEFATAIFNGKKLRFAIVADAADPTNELVGPVLDAADLIIDCSTTLAFPRAASVSERTAKHVSVFMTPSGSSSVMMIEDRARKARLHSLESQYYRAIINASWGERHLEKHLGMFYSGASCRDISFEMAASTVAVHAGTLADRFPRAVTSDEASIGIWERNLEDGTIAFHGVAAAAGRSWNLDPLTVLSDEGLLAKLRQMREDALPNETGGILVGYHDLTLGHIHIVDALSAPPDSEQSEGHFIRGIEGMPERLADIQNRTANIVGYVGEWHSHPRGHGAGQSLDDRIQSALLAIGMASDGLAFVQLIVGEDEIRVHGAPLIVTLKEE